MIPKSGDRFSEKIMRNQENPHDPEKWAPVFGQDHAGAKRQAGARRAVRSGLIRPIFPATCAGND